MRTSVRHRLVWVALLVLAVGLLSGCSVGSDDADPTSTSEPSSTSTTSTSPAPVATATVPAATATATASPVPPTPTRTPTPRPTATATPIPTEPLGEIAPIDPNVLTNYSLSTNIELKGIPSQSDFAMSLLILQSAPDHYYLRSTTGDSGIESWLVDGTTYLTQADGSVASIPEGSDTALFSPALLVQTIPAISGDVIGIKVGVEDVSGRQATHYTVDGDDLLDGTSWLPGATADDIEGQVDIWIDNELHVIVRQESNVTWENSDGSAGSFVGHYELTNIGTTEPVTAPG